MEGFPIDVGSRSQRILLSEHFCDRLSRLRYRSVEIFTQERGDRRRNLVLAEQCRVPTFSQPGRIRPERSQPDVFRASDPAFMILPSANTTRMPITDPRGRP